MLGNGGEGKAKALGDHRKGQPPQIGAGIAAVAAPVAQGRDDTVGFVKPDRRDRQAGAQGQIANGKLGLQRA
jgi:hypothetical protein